MGKVTATILSGQFDNPLTNNLTGVVSAAYQLIIDPANLNNRFLLTFSGS